MTFLTTPVAMAGLVPAVHGFSAWRFKGAVGRNGWGYEVACRGASGKDGR